MSFTPDFVPDAKSQWRELDVELQEIVLDELEKLASNPPPDVGGLIEHDFAHDRGGIRHYIFLRMVIDRRARTLRVIGIVQLTKPLPGQAS